MRKEKKNISPQYFFCSLCLEQNMHGQVSGPASFLLCFVLSQKWQSTSWPQKTAPEASVSQWWWQKETSHLISKRKAKQENDISHKMERDRTLLLCPLRPVIFRAQPRTPFHFYYAINSPSQFNFLGRHTDTGIGGAP